MPAYPPPKKRYRITKKTEEILRLLGYTLPPIVVLSSEKGWVIGNTRKFIALGMTQDEGVAGGFIEEVEPNPLWQLMESNYYIPDQWIQKHLPSDLYGRFEGWMVGQGRSEYGVFRTDVIRFLELNGL